MAEFIPGGHVDTTIEASVTQGPLGVTLPHILYSFDGATPVQRDEPGTFGSDPWVSRGQNNFTIRADFNFQPAGSFNEGGTNCRGRVGMVEVDPDDRDVLLSTPKYFYSAASNTTGADILNATITVDNSHFEPNKLYRVRIGGDVYGGDYPTGLPFISTSTDPTGFYTEFYVWGNQTPDQPVIFAPPNGATIPWEDSTPENSLFTLEWTRSDPDDVGSSEDKGGYEIQFRPAPTPLEPNPAWITESAQNFRYIGLVDRRGAYDANSLSQNTCFHFYAGPGWTFANPDAPTSVEEPCFGYPYPMPGPGTYQFRVRVFDESGSTDNPPGDFDTVPPPSDSTAISEWSSILHVNIVAPFLPPTPISPINDIAQQIDEVTFQWRFRDPRPTGGTQLSRNVRIRRAGEDEWTEIIPVGSRTSASEEYVWTNGAEGFTIEPGFRYEWQANTVSTPGDFDSGWTGETATFWAIPQPGSGLVIPTPDLTVPDPGLGCGDNRVFVYTRGGIHRLGEITNKVQVTWSRVRDDISEAVVQVSGWNEDCGQLLAALRCWQMELVIFRDNGNGPQRVWEGPITRITYEKDAVEVAAHDCMAYVYRRVLRIGFNDAYRAGGGGLTPVTQRAAWIIQNALSYDDPNLLAYMQVVSRPDDARQSRVVHEYSTTAWQMVDDFAAKSGLDYVTVGRKIILWDTHEAIGLLPEMRDGDFGVSPIVTEYGMQLANFYAVTNNNGVWGSADRLNDSGLPDYYGWIEMLSSAYGESEVAATPEVLTAEARAQLIETLNEQAERNIAGRYPAPLVARIPDNSTLNPEISVGINQLIPGAHIPLRSDITLRQVTQMQKLDRVQVIQTDDSERVSVTLSPAPRSRAEDVDAGDGGEIE